MTEHRFPAAPRLPRRSVLLALAGGGAAVPLLGTGVRAEGKPKPAGQVVIGISQEPTVFNPLLPHIEADDGIHM